MLIAPEGDTSRRRHAHTQCVLSARANGRLPTRDEWQKATGQLSPSLAGRATKALSRLLRRGETE